jgi:hypothetical protein
MLVLFVAGAAAVDELKEVAKTLRKLPVVDPELPTVGLALPALGLGHEVRCCLGC